MMVFGDVPVLSAGSQLALQEGVVYDANSENLDIRSYSTGTVFVEAPNMVCILLSNT